MRMSDIYARAIIEFRQQVGCIVELNLLKVLLAALGNSSRTFIFGHYLLDKFVAARNTLTCYCDGSMLKEIGEV